MKAKGIAIRLAVAGAGALLPFIAAAQIYRPEGVPDLSAEPSMALSLSLSDINALRLGIAGGKVGTGRLAEKSTERPEPWVLYARFYVLNFQNNLGEQSLVESRVGFGRTGPAIAGRTYIGIRKRF